MTLHEVLAALGAFGVRLGRDGDQLVLRAASGHLDAPLVEAMRSHKAALLGFVGRAPGADWPVPRVISSDALPLSSGQQRLWFVDRLDPGRPVFNERFAVRLRGAIDVPTLERALNRIVERHEVLRTHYLEVDGSPCLAIADQLVVTVDEVDLSTLPPHEREQAEARIAGERLMRPFDLAAGPVLRATLLRSGPRDQLLQVCIHHIATDGWSMGLLAAELSALYAAPGTDPLPALPIQYADHAAWQRKRADDPLLATHSAWWHERLDGAPALLTLPLDWPRPARQDHLGDTVHLEFDDGLLGRLRALARRLGCTLPMIVLAGWSATLARWSGQRDLVIGVPAANRAHPQTQSLIGFFINMLPLRLDLSGDLCGTGLVGQVKDRWIAAQAHQDVPFEHIVELVRPPRNAAHTPLFQVLFNWQQDRSAELSLDGVTMTPATLPCHVAKFDLALNCTERAGRLHVAFDHATALVDIDTIRRHAGHLVTLLEGLAANPSSPVDRLPMLGAAERRQLLEEWNDTQVPGHDGQRVHERFSAQARIHPEATAVDDGESRLSYCELDALSNRLAHTLCDAGVGEGDRVAVLAQRRPEMLVALLAVLKAGAAYVPLDPDHPAGRIDEMLRDAKPAMLLTVGAVDAALRDLLAPELPVLDVLADAPRWQSSSPDPLPRDDDDPSPLAYVIYTSGSTGVPKGVMVEHAGVVNLLDAMCRLLGVQPGQRTLALTTITFDIAALELFMPLVSGGCVVLADRRVAQDTALLAEVLRDRHVDIAQATPTTWRALIDAGWDGAPALKALCGGEALPLELSARLRQRVGALWNVYGPTESTIWSTAQDVTAHRAPSTGPYEPVGRPLANTRVYVLDERGQPVPRGSVGELLIGGAGVARGYWNRPALDRERFVADPFVPPGARMYRTGDLARQLADGRLEFLGRNDQQVKLRGHRIELGEVEAALAGHPQVKEAVLALHGQALVAYLVAVDEAALPDTAQLRQHLRHRLPDYMLPARVVALEALPRTRNGKIDRNALPAPEAVDVRAAPFEAPSGEIEATLARVWSELLKVERVGRHDDFFDLGGHSLLATRMAARVRRAIGVEIAIGELFDHPVLADLAQRLRTAARDELPPICLAPRDVALPMSFAQTRLWFLAQMENARRAYHMFCGLRITGPLDTHALRRALDRLVARHEALRTRFAQVDGELVQLLGDDTTGFDLHTADVSCVSDEDLRRLAAAEMDKPFDLADGPLIRGLLVRTGDHGHVLLIALHHIISDGWSQTVLTRETMALYAAFAAGRADPLPPLALQYADYAVWQRRWIGEAAMARQAEYWVRQLADAPAVISLPADRPRADHQDHEGAFVELTLDPELSASVAALSRRHGTTLFMTLLAGWAVLLSRLSGQLDVVVGSPVANRARAELEPLIGFFVNAVALRLDLRGAPSVAAFLQHVKAQALAAQAHQDVPFEYVVETLRPSRSLAHHPVFQTSFTWQNNEQVPLQVPGLVLAALEAPVTTTKFDLSLYFAQDGDRITGGIEYATALYDASTVQRWGEHLRQLLRAMCADDGLAVDRLPLLGAVDRRRLLGHERGVARTPAPTACLHELFQAQAAARPDAVALLHGDREISYGELNARANQLAHHLRQLGVVSDARVALCAQRGPALVIGLLAILKAGGGYVPLDPAYPAERLAFTLRDCAPRALLVQGAPALPVPQGVTVVDLDRPQDWAHEPVHDPAWRVRPVDLAYVIYTSGSTGRPKGVMVEHRHVVRLFTSTRDTFAFGPQDTWTLFHSASFDFSVWELWGALLHGGRLVIVSWAVSRSPDEFHALLCARRVTVLNQTPSAFGPLAQAQARSSSVHSLRLVVFGGEALNPTLLRPWFADARNEAALLVNMYGITETTVHVTWRAMSAQDVNWAERAATGASPIGVPIQDLRLYLLDPHGEPVPPGVVGELFVGGAGVARGYLNRESLDAERFLLDPFRDDAPGARMYRTGDLARTRGDGELEYLGRNDRQVKIRGFRIEPAEIETCLAQQDGVRQAAVLVREDTPGEQRLVAYVAAEADLPAQEAVRLAHLQVAEWSALYDQTYAKDEPEGADVGFNLAGWNSSYTREPIPREEMADWLDGVLARVGALRPRRVLEIGCGTGLILCQVAPGCEQYVGTDLSRRAIDRLARWLEGENTLAGRIALVHAQALDLAAVPGEGFDTVVLNSVVQYFPNIDYLDAVIGAALSRMADGAHLFLGDVRHLPLLRAFHLSVQLHQAPDDLPAAQLAARTAQKLGADAELVIDPAWFFTLPQRWPRIGSVKVSPKQGRFHNEMSAYRYDVVLSIGPRPSPTRADIGWVDCAAEPMGWDRIRDTIDASTSPLVGLRAIANPAVHAHVRAVALLDSATPTLDAAALRAAVASDTPGVSCADLAAHCAREGHTLHLSWAPGDAHGGYHAIVVRKGASPGDRAAAEAFDWSTQLDTDTLARSARAHANDPLRANRNAALPARLRASLAALLPEHMVPAAFVVVDALPLTPNGKLDRDALQAPEATAFATRVHEPPHGEVELALAPIWSEVLKLDRVSRADNFFDLGGHSLLATTLIARVRRDLGVSLSIQGLFEEPTFRALARQVEELLLADLGDEDLEALAEDAR
ncbi:MAG: amino acid adenylation domain-containing protein [Rhizobacter sp.]